MTTWIADSLGYGLDFDKSIMTDEDMNRIVFETNYPSVWQSSPAPSTAAWAQEATTTTTWLPI